jgi:hypothetical protein
MDFSTVKFDIILLAGQSNAQGSGYGPVEEEYLPDGILYRMNGKGEHEKYENGAWTFSLPVAITIGEVDTRVADDLAVSFARAYIRRGLLAEDRKLLILHTALGATSFALDQWTPMGLCYRRMLYMLDCALNLHPENRVVALLWHQGESDATRGATEPMHYENLCYLFENARKRAKNENMPIVAADFCADWKSENAAACAPVVAAIRRAVDDFGGVFIETADLPSNAQAKADPEDHIHFSRNSLHILGKRYFEAFDKIRTKG